MKIELGKRNFDIKDISYKERRELYIVNVKAFWKNEVDPDKYYEVLEKCAEISGLNDKDLEGLSMPEIDQLLQKILSAYLGLEKKPKGD